MRMCRWFLCLLLLSPGLEAAVVLQYHHISDKTPASTSTTPALFAAHLDYLVEQNFTVLPLPALIKKLREGGDLPDKTVAITFDDAYRSVYDTAFPLLQKYGFTFTVFVNTAAVDNSVAGSLSWSELQIMAQAGVTIANHTLSHAHMVRRQKDESQDAWETRIRTEILSAEKTIAEQVKQDEKLLAYPYGEYNAALESLVESLGYIAFGQHSGAIGPTSDWQALPRFPMGGGYGRMKDFPLKVASLPFPYTDKSLELDGSVLADATVNSGATPALLLSLDSSDQARATRCYFRGETMAGELDEKQLKVFSREPLKPGRARYNCTLLDSASGRYFWFSQPWLITGEDGQWQHQD